MGAVGKSSGFDYESARQAIVKEVAKGTNSFLSNAAVLDSLPVGSYIIIREGVNKDGHGNVTDTKLYEYAKKTGDGKYLLAEAPTAGGGEAKVLNRVYTSAEIAKEIRTSKELKYYKVRLTGDINDRKLLWKAVL